MTAFQHTAMSAEAALGEPLVRRILARVIDRLDVQPAGERTNAIRIDLDHAIAPEIHHAESLAARAVAWAAVEGAVSAGWATLGYRKHRRHGSPEEREPYLEFRWTESIEGFIRDQLQRPRKTSYAGQWRERLTQANLSLPEDALARLAGSPIQIKGRSAEEVFARFLSIRELAQQQLLLREVSSRAFWGLSKVLDARADLIALLLGCDECPFPEQPIVLNVHIHGVPRSFLFVENHVSFERLKASDALPHTAMIFSSGFRGAAARLRRPGGCSIYYSRASGESAISAFEEILFSFADVPVFFWGDLDYSGMAILKSLRSIFPSAQAWQAGYEPMLKRLTRGDGHTPIESGKEGQRVVEQVGCLYADSYLIPALQAHGCFVDQE
jgi:hypothetical protein